MAAQQILDTSCGPNPPSWGYLGGSRRGPVSLAHLRVMDTENHSASHLTPVPDAVAEGLSHDLLGPVLSLSELAARSGSATRRSMTCVARVADLMASGWAANFGSGSVKSMRGSPALRRLTHTATLRSCGGERGASPDRDRYVWGDHR